MDNNDIEHLHIYAKEFSTPITLKCLIQSHKTLRERNRKRHKEWSKELDDAREIGKKQGFEFITENEYVSKEKLKLMTISDLAMFLFDTE